jgi:dipeptidase E
MGSEPQIVGLGGYAESDEQTRLLLAHVVGLSGCQEPRILFLPTALGDTDAAVVRFYERFAGLGRLGHLRFFPWPPAEARALVLAQDAICVSGGNTANMLAIWRAHGFDLVLREAWERGVLLFGASAGMICWFEAAVTDSFGPGLEGMRDGLGLLPGSACPHYDGEAKRRPRYRELLEAGFPAGVAADDGVGLHFVGTELRDVVSVRPGAGAYRVSAAGEQPLPARLLDAGPDE